MKTGYSPAPNLRHKSTEALRRRLDKLGAQRLDPTKTKPILGALRQNVLRDQFGSDYRDTLYKGIEGADSNVRERLAKLKGRVGPDVEPGQVEKMEGLQATFRAMKQRRRGFTGSETFDKKTKTWAKSPPS